MISIIVAMSNNGVIGKDNALLWKQSADLKRFKELTSNHTILMGRNTFDSIGKPLPNRFSIVFTRDEKYSKKLEAKFNSSTLPNGTSFATVCCKNNSPLIDHWTHGGPEIFVIGGGMIYEKFMDIASTLYITEIKAELEGDTKFPLINMDIWRETSREKHFADDKNEYDYDFVTYTKTCT